MVMIKQQGDIDIDFPNRDNALSHLTHYKASIKRDKTFSKHATGIYFTEIPHDLDGNATIDYKEAEGRGYFKVDFLNVSVYEQVTSEQHLVELMTTNPPWQRLLEPDFCAQLIHIGNYNWMIKNLAEPIDSIPRLAMFLALIRPGKKHLVGKSWKEIAETIWDKTDDGYSFKRSHSVSYAHLVVVHMNLINGSN
jgi:hypothetical protein